ncbi:4'-phosphopantetheinyl transferase family protein [Streptomyces peucetius]|uniref:4'-phosphopantetheinyl transferase superfamily protein n=1 Tax=Streptomyces peucetius TaxID=1950 RepID=A0ABY6I4K6_STRPE|nr:4'-phosphopantetheinyl transferase superfamily protein [Streptomyces peucetius]
MIAELVPAEVAAVQYFGDPDVTPPVFAQEAALVERALISRRAEFRTVRACAREAMGQLGFAPVPILHGAQGEPLWPAGLVGSMAHCAGYRVAVLARAEEFAMIGVDAEPDEACPDEGIRELIAGPAELAMLARLAESHPDIAWDRLLFSAKECVYKAWYPLARRWLGFEHAAVVLEPETETFTAHLLAPGPVVNDVRLTVLRGRWAARHGLIVTAITVPATGGRSASAGSIATGSEFLRDVRA